MKSLRHVRFISKAPSQAQVSNLQIKLETTTTIIDRLLLVDRQSPWKSTGPTGDGTSTTTDTSTVDTEL